MAVSSTIRSRSSPDIFMSIQRKKKKKKKSSHSKTIGSQRRTESMVVTVRLYFWAIFSLAFSIKAVRQIKTLPGFSSLSLICFSRTGSRRMGRPARRRWWWWPTWNANDERVERESHWIGYRRPVHSCVYAVFVCLFLCSVGGGFSRTDLSRASIRW